MLRSKMGLDVKRMQAGKRNEHHSDENESYEVREECTVKITNYLLEFIYFQQFDNSYGNCI